MDDKPLPDWASQTGLTDKMLRKAGSPPKPIVRQKLLFLQSMAMQQEAIQEEVPTIYKAYFFGLCKGISSEHMALYGTNVPPF